MSPTPDPLEAIRKQLLSKQPTAQPVQPAAVTAQPTSSTQAVVSVQARSPAPVSQVEVGFQRARYFENLVEHLFAHIKDLNARLSRTGTAVPAIPHFQPLKNAAGDFDPNSQ